jgi:hypothetical protein
MTNPTLYRFDNNNAQESKECDVQRLAKRMSFFGKTKINHWLRVDDQLSRSSTDSGIGTIKRANKNTFPRIFKGCHDYTGQLVEQVAFPACIPYLGIIPFHGRQTVKKKRQRFPGTVPTCPSSLMLPYNIHSLAEE